MSPKSAAKPLESRKNSRGVNYQKRKYHRSECKRIIEEHRAHNLESLVCEVMPKPFTLQEICNTANRILMMHGAGRGRMH